MEIWALSDSVSMSTLNYLQVGQSPFFVSHPFSSHSRLFSSVALFRQSPLFVSRLLSSVAFFRLSTFFRQSLFFVTRPFSSVALFRQFRYFVSHPFSSVAVFRQSPSFVSCHFSSVDLFRQSTFSSVALFRVRYRSGEPPHFRRIAAPLWLR